MPVNMHFFKTRYGGIEMWTWIAIGVGVLLVSSAYRSRTKQPASTGSGAPPNADGGKSPYVFMVPEGRLAAPDPSQKPPQPAKPDPPKSNPQAFGFDWSPYTVLGLHASRKTAADTSPAGIASVAYGLDKDDATNAAYYASLITSNNPGIDWSRPLDSGAVVMIPKLGAVPDGATPTQYN